VSLGVLWFRKEMAKTLGCSIRLGKEWLGRIWKKKARRVPWLRTEGMHGVVHAALKWRGKQARGIHVAWRPWQQAAACTHACARRCSRGSCAGQGAGDPYRVTVATPIFPLLSPCEIQPKFELKSNFHQNKSCAKFCKLQIIFRCPKLILNGSRVILPNSLKIKLKSKKFQIFELGQNRISKITFDFV
jgi:hypothetical protein